MLHTDKHRSNLERCFIFKYLLIFYRPYSIMTQDQEEGSRVQIPHSRAAVNACRTRIGISCDQDLNRRIRVRPAVFNMPLGFWAREGENLRWHESEDLA